MNDQRLYTVRYRFPGTAVEAEKLPGQLVYAADPNSAIAEITKRVSRRAGIPRNTISIVSVKRFSQDVWQMQIPVQVGLL